MYTKLNSWHFVVGVCTLGLLLSCQQPEVVTTHSSHRLAGKWKENWSVPGKTNVHYHDLYRVLIDERGNAKIESLNKHQKTYNVKLTEDSLKFDQRSDAFEIHYSLRLEKDGQWLAGTVSTPIKVYQVNWVRAD